MYLSKSNKIIFYYLYVPTLVLKYLNIYVSRETLFATYTLYKMKIKSEIYDLKYLRVSKNE